MTRKSFIHSLLVAPFAGLVGKKAVEAPAGWKNQWDYLVSRLYDPPFTYWYKIQRTKREYYQI